MRMRLREAGGSLAGGPSGGGCAGSAVWQAVYTGHQSRLSSLLPVAQRLGCHHTLPASWYLEVTQS